MFKLESLRGILPPILTPLDEEERVDRVSMRRLVDYVVEGGVHGIWVTGTTGEFACIDEKERAKAVEAAVEATNGRVPVVAGIGDASTALAIRHGLNARAAGVDVVALVPPYYYVNSQEEMLTHYRAVREKVDVPLMVYNIPQNVKVKLDVKTVLTLAAEGTVIGLKDSQNDLDWFRQVMIGVRQAGKEFRGFLGTRYLIDAGVVAGAHGAIPSIANVGPSLASTSYEAAVRGDWATAARAQEQLGLLSVRLASAPALLPALKGAMKVLGVFSSARMTLPFHTVTPAQEEKIKGILEEVGVRLRS